MRAILTATALAGALAVTPIAALAQQDPGQAGAPETQSTPMPQTEAPGTQADTQAGGQADAASDAEGYRVLSTAQDFEGLDFSEVRIESVEEVPRDQVMAINSSLDPSNQEAAALREELNGLEGVEQALSEESIEEERIVGAAIEDNDLIVYVLPEGQTREQWGAQMPDPSGDATSGAGGAGQPGEAGAAGADQQPSGGAADGGAAGSTERPSGGSAY